MRIALGNHRAFFGTVGWERNPDFVFLFNPVESSGSASVDSDLSRSDPAMEDAVRQIETPGQKLQKLLARFGVGDDKRFGHGRLA